MLHVQVFAWGLNTSGQLGLNDALVRKSPAVVDALWAMPVQQLAAGKHLAVDAFAGHSLVAFIHQKHMLHRLRRAC